MEEIWKDIEGYEGLYQVSNLGRVKSLARFRIKRNSKKYFYQEKILVQAISANGYYKVTLYKESKQSNKDVHRLLALYFIPNPDNKPQVNHKNGIKTDNSIENLEWVTNSENIKHAFDYIGINVSKGETHYKSFLTSEQVRQVKEKLTMNTNKEIALEFGICHKTISAIRNNKRWKHI